MTSFDAESLYTHRANPRAEQGWGAVSETFQGCRALRFPKRIGNPFYSVPAPLAGR